MVYIVHSLSEFLQMSLSLEISCVVVVVQVLSLVKLFATPCTAGWQASLSITNSWRLLKLMSIESMVPSNHLILSFPLLLLPSIFPSIRVFSNVLVFSIIWPKYWGFSFSISTSNEYSGLISFRIDWFDFLAVQGTIKSLLQHHSSKASILQCSAFFTVSHIHTWLLENVSFHSSPQIEQRNRMIKIPHNCTHFTC